MLKCKSLAITRPVDEPLFTYQRSLDQQLQDLRDTVTERKAHIKEIEKQETILCQQLDEPVKGLQYGSNRLPSGEEMENFEFYLHELQVLLDSRCEKVVNLRLQIKTIADEIELDISRSGLMTQKLQMTASNIDDLEEFLEQVRADKMNIKSEINNKWTTLQTLYDRLDTSPRSRIAVSQPLTKVTIIITFVCVYI